MSSHLHVYVGPYAVVKPSADYGGRPRSFRFFDLKDEHAELLYSPELYEAETRKVLLPNRRIEGAVTLSEYGGGNRTVTKIDACDIEAQLQAFKTMAGPAFEAILELMGGESDCLEFSWGTVPYYA